MKRPGSKATRAGRKATEELRARIARGLRSTRKARRLTQADVAMELGMATEVYGRMERGLVLPSLPTFLMVCAQLEVSVEQAIGEGADLEPASGKSGLSGLAARLPDSKDMRALLRLLLRAPPRQVRLLRIVASGMASPRERRPR